ncbi:hypothetical protein TNCV_2890051 [Trichonephila clavipes]|nr:hypothetical protein TNCV_2890051 [Trichonephila clavipes]
MSLEYRVGQSFRLKDHNVEERMIQEGRTFLKGLQSFTDFASLRKGDERRALDGENLSRAQKKETWSETGVERKERR